MEALIGLILGLIIGAVLLAIVAFIFQWLWNSTLPDVFGVKDVSLWQAFKILLISAMLFGGGTTVFERGHEVVPDEVIADQIG